MTSVLELDGVAQRTETYRFDLLDAANTVVAQGIDVEADQPASVNNDVNRNIRRTLDGLHLSPSVLADIDTLSDRLQPVVTIDGTEYPVGVFLFGDHRVRRYSWGDEPTSTLVDQCVILDDPISTSVGYDTGTVVTTAIAAQAAAAGIVAVSIDASTATIQAPIAWAIGQHSRLKIIGDLCALAGFLAPYFDNAGTLICRAAPSLATATADFTYGLGTATSGRVIDGTIDVRDDLLSAPNRYLAVATDATAGDISGVFNVPDSAPYSAANRGRTITTVIRAQGLADPAAAAAAAEARYTQDSSTFQWVSFDAVPDPRHDTHDLVGFDGDLFREQGWKLRLAPGGPHEHDLRRVYQ